MMNYKATISSPDRIEFLETTQEELLQNLELDSVVEALGTRAVNRIMGLNDLLVPPLVEDDCFAYIPPMHRMSDSVPYVALRPNETLRFNSADLLSSPAQMRSVRRTLEKWSNGDEQNVLISQSNLVAAIAGKLPAEVRMGLPRKSVDGIVWHIDTLMRNSEIGLSGAPSVFYQSTRPILGLGFSGGNMTTAILVHELSHVDWQITQPIFVGSKEEKVKNLYRNELQAHYYSAKYALGVARTKGKLKQLFDYPVIAQHTAIENIRQKYADPEQPFEPTPKLISELGRAGITWTVKEISNRHP